MSSPTETQRYMESRIAVFRRYAGKDSNGFTLSKTEFLTFINTELAAFTKNQKDPGVLDRIMKRLDVNSDGQLDFQEFLNLTGGLEVARHELLAVPRSEPEEPMELASRPPPSLPASQSSSPRRPHIP